MRGGTRGRTAVLDFFSQQLAPRLVQQGAEDGGAAAAAHHGGGMPDSRAMRAWLRRVASLAGEPETSPLSVPLENRRNGNWQPHSICQHQISWQ